jgi:tripartite-type tricarboxylate transporter receptor subunit TctC
MHPALREFDVQLGKCVAARTAPPAHEKGGEDVSRRIVLPRIALSAVAAAILTGAVAFPVFSQVYPTKPVRIIVPYAPGGSGDTLGRLVAPKLSESFGQPFIIENRAGAGGMVGSEQVARSAPDGYTLGVSGVATHAVGPAMSAKPPFDPVKDFSPVAPFGGPPPVFARA